MFPVWTASSESDRSPPDLNRGSGAERSPPDLHHKESPKIHQKKFRRHPRNKCQEQCQIEYRDYFLDIVRRKMEEEDERTILKSSRSGSSHMKSSQPLNFIRIVLSSLPLPQSFAQETWNLPDRMSENGLVGFLVFFTKLTTFLYFWCLTKALTC